MEAQDYVAAIRRKGLTQAQIAERSGIPQSTVSKVERGDVKDVLSKNYRALQALHNEVGHLPDVVSPVTGANPGAPTIEPFKNLKSAIAEERTGAGLLPAGQGAS